MCGYNYEGIIINCYATGSVSGGADHDFSSFTGALGGLLGSNNGTISNCFSSGSLTGGYNSSDIGGLCGANTIGSVSDCYFLDSAGPDNGYGQPLDDPNMRIQLSFVGWDFMGDMNGTEDIWQLCIDGYDYPRLAWQFNSPADFLYPGRVDQYDLFTLTNDWLTENSRCCDIFPPEGDNTVNLFDYIEFSRYWLNE